MALAVAAQEPSQLELATGIALAFPRSPTTVAYSSWDLQRMSQGRFVLGLGSQVKGHIERRFGVEWLPAAPRMKDYILALRAVWSCWQDHTPLRHEGKYYKLSLMIPTFTPPPQSQELKPKGLWSRPLLPWENGVRPNSPAQTIRVSSSNPQRRRSLMSAAIG